MGVKASVGVKASPQPPLSRQGYHDQYCAQYRSDKKEVGHQGDKLSIVAITWRLSRSIPLSIVAITGRLSRSGTLSIVAITRRLSSLSLKERQLWRRVEWVIEQRG